jgi:hypothetical protein
LVGWKVIADGQPARVSDRQWEMFAEGPEGHRFRVPFHVISSSSPAEALRVLPLPAGTYDIRVGDDLSDTAAACDLEPIVLAPR